MNMDKTECVVPLKAQRLLSAYIAAQKAIQVVEEDLNARAENLFRQRVLDAWPDVVNLNVGGYIYTASISTLRKDPDSFLYHLFTSDPQTALPRDHLGRYFLDRDGASFRYILNYLRGYQPLNVPIELLHRVRYDIEYYGLHRMKKDLPFLRDDRNWYFVRGLGVSSDTTSYNRGGSAVILCQGDWLHEKEIYTIIFQCEKSDGLGLGIVSSTFNEFDKDFSTSANCAMYSHSGSIYTNFPTVLRDPVVGPKIQDGDRIEIRLDLRTQHLEWLRNDDSVRLVTIPSSSTWKFAVRVRENSSVRIVSKTSSAT